MVSIRQINNHITIGLLDLRSFSDQENIRLKREQEKAGTRHLLKHLLKTEDFELVYTPENKPYLKERSEHISISHSHDKLVIILNTQQNTGIDIEQIRDKVKNIQSKFLSEKELAFAKDDTAKLITLWAAKEAMYKAYGLKEVEFIRNISVEDYNGPELKGKLEVNGFAKAYQLIQEEIEGYKLVYILHEL